MGAAEMPQVGSSAWHPSWPSATTRATESTPPAEETSPSALLDECDQMLTLRSSSGMANSPSLTRMGPAARAWRVPGRTCSPRCRTPMCELAPSMTSTAGRA
ncbi:uncharacterized protein AMSG_11671 [Thecamonas trahens ATCC 50062]|uniref:Uncharacterized protein n=1 Tax=Thecamonas trahens ATCC 50062 TaxID=461836 RepID=A0A0L0DUB0_THETB|nr:hypothetical protein AMSG_11671 [Thecamonas trahens ATCC 50062]KNC55626.1 hypothetical protein AMSG_11671 [Thecamonas trahens ATCC 50062]|eukprot:XP_013761477.1 hypothetical protein AMSG_11671 [Thecamonas trahens ATCC 50062]